MQIGAGVVLAAIATVQWWPDGAPESAASPPPTKLAHASAWGASPFGEGGVDAALPRPHRSMLDAPPPALFARNGRIVDLHGLSAAAYIAQWSTRARTGDVQAAYNVFQAADVCAAISEPLPEMQAGDDKQALLKERAELERVCKNVTPAQIAERMDFLAIAARAGNHDAQIDFYMEGPNGRQAQAGDNDETTAQWKQQSLAYLQAAASGGNTFSLGLLANSYDAGLLTPPDAKLSLAYTVADMMARNVTATPSLLRNRFGSQLSDDDFNAGMQMGAQIAAQCCGRQ
jgi:hypothetical protein